MTDRISLTDLEDFLVDEAVDLVLSIGGGLPTRVQEQKAVRIAKLLKAHDLHEVVEHRLKGWNR